MTSLLELPIIITRVWIEGQPEWCAYRYGHERPGAYGYGTTREEAIANLHKRKETDHEYI
jgi:hypothetical protein